MSELSQNGIFTIKILSMIFLVLALIQEIRLIYSINKVVREKIEYIENLEFIRANDIYNLQILEKSKTKIYVISSITILFYSVFLFYLLFMDKISSELKQKLNIIIRVIILLFLILSIFKLLFKNPTIFLDIIIFSYILVFLNKIK